MGTSTPIERTARMVSGGSVGSAIIARRLCGLAFCVPTRMQNERIAHGAMQRRRHGDLGAKIDHPTRKPLQLQGPALLEVMVHRRSHVGMQRVREGQSLLREIVRDRNTVSTP